MPYLVQPLHYLNKETEPKSSELIFPSTQKWEVKSQAHSQISSCLTHGFFITTNSNSVYYTSEKLEILEFVSHDVY